MMITVLLQHRRDAKYRKGITMIVSNEISHAVENFLHQHGLHHVIAFSGGASLALPGVAESDELHRNYADVQKEREARIASEALNILRHYRVAILTGGTRFGFPKTAFEQAKDVGLKTIGVFPQTAAEKGYVLPDLDLPICVEPLFGDSAWGDESSVFSKVLDAVIVVGGGAGTLIEAAHLLKMNESRIKYGEEPKHLIPIHGTGGVADGLPFVWGKQEIKHACMPHEPIESGMEAARYIVECLDLFNQ
jgi:predicted Rossmann-fold nucleotide-binding protein